LWLPLLLFGSIAKCLTTQQTSNLKTAAIWPHRFKPYQGQAIVSMKNKLYNHDLILVRSRKWLESVSISL
jgi:hypothetical protein